MHNISERLFLLWIFYSLLFWGLGKALKDACLVPTP